MKFNKIWKWKAAGTMMLSAPFLSPVRTSAQPTVSSIRLTASSEPGLIHTMISNYQAPHGSSQLLPYKMVKSNDGGKLFYFTVKGKTVIEPVPPDGFNPLNASKAELEKYGLPLPPSDPTLYAKWKSFVTSLDFINNPKMFETDNQNTVNNHDNGFYNHYGYVALAPSDTNSPPETDPPYGDFISNITAEYYQVSAENTNCANPAESTWISFGGYNSPGASYVQGMPFTQIGSYINPGGGVVPFYEFFSQTGVDSNAQILNLPDDSPGALMSAYMAFSGDTNSIALILSVQSVTNPDGSHPTIEVQIPNAYEPQNPAENYYFPYAASISIEAPTLDGYPFYSGVRPMVDFGVQNFQQANVGFWNTQKVIWKTLGSYNLTEESGTGSLTGKVQVELSNLGQDNASFSGNWLSC